MWGGDAVEVVEDVSNDRTLLCSDTAVCPLDAGHSARSQLSRCGISRRACVDHLLRREGRKVGKGREVGRRRDRSKKVSELRTRWRRMREIRFNQVAGNLFPRQGNEF